MKNTLMKMRMLRQITLNRQNTQSNEFGKHTRPILSQSSTTNLMLKMRFTFLTN
ncbi:MAG: hypothetical protein ABI263_03315 [Gelidibacter sp.]